MKNKIKYALTLALLSSINLLGQTYLNVSVNEKIKPFSSKGTRVTENDIIKLKLNIKRNLKIDDIKFILALRKRCCGEQVVSELQEQLLNNCEILICEIDKIEDLPSPSSEVIQFTFNEVLRSPQTCKGTNIRLIMSYRLNQKEEKSEVYNFYLLL